MGGLGSGRPSSGRPVVEQFRSIDVNRLNREGLLSHDGVGAQLHWRDEDGERVASVNVSYRDGWLRLNYSFREYDGDWQQVSEPVLIERVPCNYGKSRPYFRCPRCGRRCAKLHGASVRFLCRKCYRLSYACQAEAPWDRAIRRSNKIKRRLGGNGEWNEFIPRPKGMWRRTYDRAMEKIWKLEGEAEDYLNDQLMLRLSSILSRP